MAITTSDAGTAVTGADIAWVRYAAIRSALSLEIKTGMRRSGRAITTIMRDEGMQFRTKRELYELLNVNLVLAGWEDRPLEGMRPVLPELKQAYWDLADELNDEDVPPFNAADWDEATCLYAEAWAHRNDLPWPPVHGTFEAICEAERNGS